VREKIILLAALYTAAISSVAQATQTKELIFYCISTPDMPDYQYVENIIRPSLESKGYSVRFLHDSATKGIEMLRNKTVDGDCGRAYRFAERTNLNILQVTPAFRYANTSMWGNAESYQKLQETPEKLRIGHLKGAVYLSQLLNHSGFANLTEYADTTAQIKALRENKVDAIFTYDAAISAFNPTQLKLEGIQRLRHIASFPAHIYVQPEHAELLPILSKAVSKQQERLPYESFGETPIPNQKPSTIVFGCAIPGRTEAFKEVEALYRKAFDELGYQFAMVSLPRARELAELNSGRLDGSCARGLKAPFNALRPMIKVATPIVKYSIQILSNKAGQSLSNGKVEAGSRVAYVRGGNITKEYIPHLGSIRPTPVTNAAIGIKMLAAKRVDYLIDTTTTLSTTLKSLRIDQPIYTVRTFDENYLYPFLSHRHAMLATPLAGKLEDLLSTQENNLLLNDH
jgi:ABC-type amino acid transport substrate-binding protein